MSEEYIWIEALFNRISVPYPLFSLTVAVIVYLIFEFFSTRIDIFKLNDFSVLIPYLAGSILIAYQLAGIQYLLRNIRRIFGNPSLFRDYNYSLDNLKKVFAGSHLYSIILLIFAVFVMIDLMHIYCQFGNACNYCGTNIGEKHMFYTRYLEFSQLYSWNFGLDVYRIVVNFLGYYLLGVILWIIFGISKVLGDISGNFNNGKIDVELFHVDRIGGLKSLLDLVAKVSIYYLICIIIMIISNYSPAQPTPPQETFVLSVLLFIGIGFFFWGKAAVQSIFAQKIQLELDDVNHECKNQEKKLRALLSKERNGRSQGQDANGQVLDVKSQDELTFISNSIELLNDERDRLLQIKTNVIDISTLLPFIVSVLTAFVAILEQFQELKSQLAGLFH